MKDTLEAYINEHISEFDTVELPADLWSKINRRTEGKPIRAVKSKLLSKSIYFGLSATIIGVTTMYFVVSEKENSHPIDPVEKPKQTMMGFEKQVNDSEHNLNAANLRKETLVLKNKTISDPVEEAITAPDSASQVKSLSLMQDSSKANLKGLEDLVDISGTPRHIFYHISANGGPDIHRHALFWYAHRELPNTYFIVEQLCWNKWVKQGKFAGKGRPGHGVYAGKIPGKFLYKYKIPAHSGENRMRVLLMNDSNICIAVSKELVWVNDKIPKVSYALKRRNNEINFSTETYYELYDPSGALVGKGRAKTISYAGFAAGTYTLNYDNSSTSIKLK